MLGSAGASLTGEQIENIVLDFGEHTEVAVHTVEEREEVLAPEAFDRLTANVRARRTGAAAYPEW
ncbi:hypothetical protein [Streptomyces sp. NBC_00503]|uniref:hypothetical protein n=1 Tax=Streptomyces sp. NBC_00503 TaxID=2903659 RepID=UPI002E808516|nr:hypothetical protein [Streptomyces sp. NBC_00503]WUD79199.1 hypothetical protein OG490_00590 [Streptomyces sp. NBC_00503]